jgi:hypothetical protein
MNATDNEVIEVLYEQVDGIHVFTAASENGRGLFVGHYDLRVAYDEVAFQLKNLLRVNEGRDGDVVPEMPFEEFKAWMTRTTQQVTTRKSPAAAQFAWKEAA